MRENNIVYEVILARELSDHGLKVERILPVHKKQVQTYLRLTTGLKLGTLLNFGEAVLKSGLTRCVNGLEEENLPQLQRMRSNGLASKRRTAEEL